MAEQTNPPAGWYPNAQGDIRWWDGQQWADEKTGKMILKQQHREQKDRDRNTKLKTLAHFSWIFFAIGLFIMFVSGGDLELISVGAGLMSLGIGTWIIWLAIGAVVDELRRHRP